MMPILHGLPKVNIRPPIQRNVQPDFPLAFEALITRVLALSNAPSKYEIAERIAEEIETAEHLKKLRAQRAA